MNSFRNPKHWLAFMALACVLCFLFTVATGKLGHIEFELQHPMPDIKFRYTPPEPPAASSRLHPHGRVRHTKQH